MDIETKVSVKNSNDEIVSADVKLYNDSGDVVKSMTIIESEVLANLQSSITDWDETYVTNDNLVNILENNTESTLINATTLRGLESDEVVTFDDLKKTSVTAYPKQHDSNTPTYGAGTTSKYGHVKLRDNLNATNYVSAEALSSHQGKVLDDKISNMGDDVDTLKSQYYANSLRVTIVRNDGSAPNKPVIDIIRGQQGIYAKVTCDDPDFSISNRTCIIIINGVPYTRNTNANGETGNIMIKSLPAGQYVVEVMVRGNDNVRAAHDMKILNVA